jgi:formylmethanofuran dehydrogenase subunit E
LPAMQALRRATAEKRRTNMEQIGKYTFEEYCRLAAGAHGNLAPGMVVGGIMVDLARTRIPEGVLFDAICETAACLPDAVHLLTPCSVGNQWLKVLDLGRYALTLYNKYTGEGARVFVDTARLNDWPAIKEWFLKTKPKKMQDKERLIAEIKEAGYAILGIEPVRVAGSFLARPPKKVGVCPLCGEAYRLGDGPVCPACSGAALPYETEGPADKDVPSSQKLTHTS